MGNSALYAIMLLALAVMIISLEWDKVRRINLKQLFGILIVLFFLGSAIAYLFTY